MGAPVTRLDHSIAGEDATVSGLALHVANALKPTLYFGCASSLADEDVAIRVMELNSGFVSMVTAMGRQFPGGSVTVATGLSDNCL